MSACTSERVLIHMTGAGSSNDEACGGFKQVPCGDSACGCGLLLGADGLCSESSPGGCVQAAAVTSGEGVHASCCKFYLLTLRKLMAEATLCDSTVWPAGQLWHTNATVLPRNALIGSMTWQWATNFTCFQGMISVQCVSRHCLVLAGGAVLDQSSNRCGEVDLPACTDSGVQPCACGLAANENNLCEAVDASEPCPVRPYCGKQGQIVCASPPEQPCDDGLNVYDMNNTCVGAQPNSSPE